MIIIFVILGVLGVRSLWKNKVIFVESVPDEIVVGEGCRAGNACCDVGELCLTQPVLRSEDWCDRYLQVCRKQADGHCGWDQAGVERARTCVKNKEYPDPYSLVPFPFNLFY
jgi:hypothetical protein